MANKEVIVKVAITEAGRGGRAPPSSPPPSPLFLSIHLFFFCNYFEALQTVSFEVELIINNAPLTYVYPITIETRLTPNHLLFGRQFLSQALLIK